MAQGSQDRLGEILVESGALSAAQLDLAHGEQLRSGELLGDALVRMGFVARAAVAEALAKQAGIPFVRLREERADPKARERVTEEVARRLRAVPIRANEDRLVVALADFYDVRAVDELTALTGMQIDVVAAAEDSVSAAIDQLYSGAEDDDGRIETTLQRLGGAEGEEDESAVVGVVRGILTRALQKGATDVHVEPEEKTVRVRYRVDGVLVAGPTIPKELQAGVISRIKIMARLNISESRLPQDGRIDFRQGKREVDVRVSTFPTYYGETVVLRVLDRERMVLGLESLGMGPELLKHYRRLIHRPNGIILVTGPTGSGKTTSLYSTLLEINSLDKKIVTLEDPIEYHLPFIRQAQVNTKAGLTFAVGLRAIFRQDPDVILVGEVRDQETVQMAIRSSLTGHLVFSTIHTNDATSTITRLLDMEVEPYLLTSSLIGVVAQRLVRNLCVQCRQPIPAPADLRRELAGVGHPDMEDIYQAVGCDRCNGTGFKGRTGLFEILEITPEIRGMILAQASADELRARAVALGMRTLYQDGLVRVAEGQTTVEEILRSTHA